MVEVTLDPFIDQIAHFADPQADADDFRRPAGAGVAEDHLEDALCDGKLMHNSIHPAAPFITQSTGDENIIAFFFGFPPVMHSLISVSLFIMV
jgi:hypothetical protein